MPPRRVGQPFRPASRAKALGSHGRWVSLKPRLAGDRSLHHTRFQIDCRPIDRRIDRSPLAQITRIRLRLNPSRSLIVENDRPSA